MSPIKEFGRVVWATVADPRGGNTKRRPLVIVHPPDKMQPGRPFLCVAISTQFPVPVPEVCVSLQWSNEGVTQSRLKQPCVAVCSWPVLLSDDEVDEWGGTLPTAEMVAIVNQLRELAKSARKVDGH